MPDQLINGNFIAIPEKTLLCKEWKNLSVSTKCVYWTMLLRYKRKGKSAEGLVTWLQSELVQYTGLSLRTVKTAIKDLKMRGWIKTWEPGGRWSRATTYKMNSLYANGYTTTGQKPKKLTDIVPQGNKEFNV